MLACCFGPAVTVEAASQQIVKGELGAKVDEYLRRLAALGFCGAAVVAKDGDVLLSKGYGRADREKGVPVAPDTVFGFGSANPCRMVGRTLSFASFARTLTNSTVCRLSAPPSAWSIFGTAPGPIWPSFSNAFFALGEAGSPSPRIWVMSRSACIALMKFINVRVQRCTGPSAGAAHPT